MQEELQNPTVARDRPDPERYRARSAALTLAAVFILFFAGGALLQRLRQHQQEQTLARPLGVFWQVWDLLESDFYGDLPSPQQRTYGAIRGALALLNDPYTVFLEPPSGEVDRDRLAGEYGGIGLELWRDAQGNVVVWPYPGSPAEAAGVRVGDYLQAVDGFPVAAEPLDAVHARLRGEVDTPVTLTLSRPPTPPFDLTVVRAQIQIPSVSFRVLDQYPAVGYLHLTTFTERTPQEASEAVKALLAQGVTGLVLDLRDNGGGLIGSAVRVADLFLDGGVVLYERRRGGEETVYQAHPGGAPAGLSLAVLVNGSTASAAEMVAGAIQVRGRGILVGEPTFGKGSVQLVYTLSDGSSLHVTSAVWLLPNGQPIGPEGLSPDIPLGRGDGLADVQLERAARYLQGGD